MYKAKVYVKGPPYRKITCQTFLGQGKYAVTDDLKEAEIVVWTGGEDINPVLYGEQAIPGTFYTERDKGDLDTLKEALDLGNKFLVGICRGAQLLNCVPNGGKLWQDVNGHENGVHRAFDCVTGSWILVNSVHHQMLRPTDKAQVLCWAQEATVKKAETETWHKSLSRHGSIVLEKDKDPEVVWYPDTSSFLFQGHPEFSHPGTTQYFFSLMDKLFWNKFEETRAA